MWKMILEAIHFGFSGYGFLGDIMQLRQKHKNKYTSDFLLTFSQFLWIKTVLFHTKPYIYVNSV